MYDKPNTSTTRLLQSAQHAATVLLVEDSEDEAHLLYAELMARGFNMDYTRVQSRQEMSHALDAHQWDLIISDHVMPGFDSLSALETLRTSGKDIPFIIYSGSIPDDLGHHAMLCGVGDVVRKGNVDHLLPVLHREIRGARARLSAREADNRLQTIISTDTLSGLPNLSRFCALIDANCDDDNEPHGALLYIDIDRFMRINQSFGYQAGDALLTMIARRLGECVECNATLGRLNADRFGLYLPSATDHAAAHTMANWVLKAFDMPFKHDSYELWLTPSIGIAMLPDDGENALELIAHAESAMTVVKRQGGNAICFFQPELNVGTTERMALETDLRYAIDRQELEVLYQPCLDTTRRIVGVEALMRWNHPLRGPIPPTRFLPIAEEIGLIVELGEWVLYQACSQLRTWQLMGLEQLTLSVNVSAVQFSQPRIVTTVHRVLKETGVNPANLILELTESVLMQDAGSTISMLRSLKNLGVRIAMDDFGTGYSSLAYLKRFPIDLLKIDRSFVQELPGNDEDAAIVRAVMALASSLQLQVVAEGVETEDQYQFLSSEGCNRFQGHLFSPALNAAKLAEMAVDVRMGCVRRQYSMLH